MAKKKKVKVEDEAPKPSRKSGAGDNKKKIIIAVVVVIIVVIAVVSFIVLRGEDGGNGDSDGNQDPLAAFTYTPTQVYANDSVDFDASNSTDPDPEDELQYSWEFGDPYANSGNPNTGEGVTESHVYTMPGTYNVTLTVEDGKGGTDMEEKEITVVPEESPSVTVTPSKPNNSLTNIIWKLTVSAVDGTDEQLALTNIRYNFYNGSNTNEVKLTGLVSNLGPTDKIPPYNNPDGLYFDDLDPNSILSVGDTLSIAGDGGISIQTGDNFQFIYEPNQGEMMELVALT